MTSPLPTGATPHLGVVLPQAEIRPSDPSVVQAFARHVEELGFDHLLAFDHVLGADSASRPDWDGYYDHTTPFLEPLVLFAYLAATTRLEMVTDILVLPQRQTAVVAKQAATLDLLLNGRLRLGIGIGWNEVEFAALGMEFRRRAERLEEQVSLLRQFWTEAVVTHEGAFDHVDRAGIDPRPLQRPIPLWIGSGDSPVALERVARLADGWIPLPGLGNGERLAAAVAQLREMAERSGRDPSSIGLQGHVRVRESDATKLAGQLERWTLLGATHVAVNTLEMGLAWPQGHLDACAAAAHTWRVSGS